MVIQELLSFWKDKSSLKHVFDNFDVMLVASKNMFETACDAVFLGKNDINRTRRRLVKIDSRINTLQQIIRRDIIMHVAVQGTADIVPCLVMMSITKDAERTGDYSKNIAEIAEHCPTINKDPLIETLAEMRTTISSWYEKTKWAFENTDKDLARTTREEAYRLERQCDKMLWELTDENLGRNAAAVALLIRYFKRIVAHLGNILTTVVMPFDKIDYYEKED